MATYTTTMTVNGQITIPKELREKFNLRPGYKIRIDATDNYFRINREETLDEILAELDAIPFSEKSKKLIKKYAGKTASELREIYANSPEGKAYYREKYGV